MSTDRCSAHMLQGPTRNLGPPTFGSHRPTSRIWGSEMKLGVRNCSGTGNLEVGNRSRAGTVPAPGRTPGRRDPEEVNAHRRPTAHSARLGVAQEGLAAYSRSNPASTAPPHAA